MDFIDKILAPPSNNPRKASSSFYIWLTLLILFAILLVFYFIQVQESANRGDFGYGLTPFGLAPLVIVFICSIGVVFSIASGNFLKSIQSIAALLFGLLFLPLVIILLQVFGLNFSLPIYVVFDILIILALLYKIWKRKV